MDKETQRIAWSCLPKEFREEVKSHYAGLNAAYQAFLSKDSLTNAECDRCNVMRENIALYNMYFGRHNLTSDAEGEEMLTVPRKKVQNYKRAIDEFLPKAFSNYDKGFWTGQKAAVDELFGSKCLLDEEPLSQNPVENCNTENHISADCDKPAEPKIKVGDKVRLKDVYEIEEIDEEKAMVGLKGCAYMENIDNLEPYTEPKEDKHFDNIIKDGFRNHNRLQIATQITASIYSNYEAAKQFGSIEAIVRKALDIADTLIAEAEKGVAL